MVGLKTSRSDKEESERANNVLENKEKHKNAVILSVMYSQHMSNSCNKWQDMDCPTSELSESSKLHRYIFSEISIKNWPRRIGVVAGDGGQHTVSLLKL